MTELLRILESAYKHGITEQEILFVLDDKNPTRRSYIMHDDDDGNAQDMFVAHTGTRPWPIEVGISYRVDESIVFHASKLTPEYQNMYETEP
jgi:hypothetical protein